MSLPTAPDSRFAAKIFPSPNHGERKGGAAGREGATEGATRRPDMLILHYTGMPTGQEAIARRHVEQVGHAVLLASTDSVQ